MLFQKKIITDKKFLKKDMHWGAISKSLAIIEFDCQGNILGANENFLNTMGYTLDEVVGKHHSMFCDERLVSSDEYRIFWRELKTGEAKSETFQRITKENESIWLEASYNPVLKGGVVTSVIKIAQDVTHKLNKANASLFMNNAINKALAVIEFDLDGNILSANENFSKVMGYSSNEIIGKHHSMFCDLEKIGYLEYKAFWEDLNRGLFKSGQFARLTKYKKEVWLESTYNPIFNQDGDLLKVIKIAKDVTLEVSNRISDKKNAEVVYQISKDAKRISDINKDLMNNTGNKVTEINEMMIESEEMMVTLNKRVSEINELLEKIKGISHQTHLLSLNASIEAASAGVHGKGFAVVAAEVKRLAGITQNASSDISGVINAIKVDSQSALKKIKSCAGKSKETFDATEKVKEGLNTIELELQNLNDRVSEFSNITK